MSAIREGATEHGEDAAAAAKPRVRDRIFETACELFYRHGIRAVGVDAIASEAGTNKMSFYRSFASKDELVTAYLHEREREFWDSWDQTVAPHAGNPRRQIEALFEMQTAVVRDKNCRGCALGNAAVEISDHDDQLAAVVRGYKREIRKRLRHLAHEMGASRADELGDALMLLMDGSYFTRLVFPGNSGPIAGLLPAVRVLIDAYSRAVDSRSG